MQKANKKLNKVYRHPIILERKGNAIQNNDGSWTKGAWVEFRRVFANVKNLHGEEYFIAGQTNEQGTLKFYIRYMPGLTNETKSSYRVIFKGKKYNINFVDNINYANEELELKAIERGMTDAAI